MDLITDNVDLEKNPKSIIYMMQMPVFIDSNWFPILVQNFSLHKLNSAWFTR